MALKYKGNFDAKRGENTGGRTGSRRVEYNGFNWQLKPSILDNRLTRRVKAGDTDRENFGEVIASHIGRELLSEKELGYEAIPEVKLIHDEEKHRILVASKYIEGTKSTLDAYIDEQNNRDPKTKSKKRHVKFVKDGADINNREYNIGEDKNKKLRKEICRGIAVSMALGDHDVNPGNFVVSENNGKNHVARIDLGHAFNDFINAPKEFGGQVRNKNNRIIDFLNREQVANIKGGAKSTLWRDFPGLIPSQEMADALKDLAGDDKKEAILKGANAAYAEFQKLYESMLVNNQYEEAAHLKKSLMAIQNNIKDDKSHSPDFVHFETNSNEANQKFSQINQAFMAITNFALQNQEQMRFAGDLMQLQVNIDNHIQSNIPTLREITAEYNDFRDKYNRMSQIQWIKTDANEPAYVGNLNQYIEHRAVQLSPAAQQNQKADKSFSTKIENIMQDASNKFDSFKAKMNTRSSSLMSVLNNLEKKAHENNIDIKNEKGKSKFDEVRELVTQYKDRMSSEIANKIKNTMYEINTSVTKAMSKYQEKNEKKAERKMKK